MRLVAVCVMALVFGFIGSMPLAGPIAIMSVSRATRGKFGDALRIGVGAGAAEGIYAGLAFWGYTTFLARHAIVVPISHGATAIVLVGVGIRFALWKPPTGEDDKNETGEKKAGTALLGFSVAAINPTLMLTWSAAVAFLYSRGLNDASPAYAVPFGLCAFGGVSAWFVLLTALLRRYEGKLPDGLLKGFIRIMGVVLVVLGIWSGVKLVRML